MKNINIAIVRIIKNMYRSIYHALAEEALVQTKVKDMVYLLKIIIYPALSAELLWKVESEFCVHMK